MISSCATYHESVRSTRLSKGGYRQDTECGRRARGRRDLSNPHARKPYRKSRRGEVVGDHTRASGAQFDLSKGKSEITGADANE